MNRNLMTMTFAELEELEIFKKPKATYSLPDFIEYELIWKPNNNVLETSTSLDNIKESVRRYVKLGNNINNMYIDCDDPNFEILDGKEILPEKYLKKSGIMVSYGYTTTDDEGNNIRIMYDKPIEIQIDENFSWE